MEIQIPMELPLDSDGYLRRQCPRCERVFKWHHDSDDDRPDGSEAPEVYFCPYCGKPSPPDQWLTDEQVDYAQALLAIEAANMVERELRPSFDRLNRSGQGLIRVQVEHVPRSTPPPPPLFEPDDMIAVEPPCHPAEPIKVIEDWDGELHCLICGDPFVLPPES